MFGEHDLDQSMTLDVEDVDFLDEFVEQFGCEALPPAEGWLTSSPNLLVPPTKLDTLSTCSQQTLGKQEPLSRSARSALESNRRCQRRYREKKRVSVTVVLWSNPTCTLTTAGNLWLNIYLGHNLSHKLQAQWQKLEAELTEHRAALKRLQSERQLSTDLSLAVSSTRQANTRLPPVTNVSWQVS